MTDRGVAESLSEVIRNALPFLGLLFTIVVLDRTTRAMVDLAVDDIFETSLLFASIQRNSAFWGLAVAATAVGGGALAFTGTGIRRFFEPWNGLEHGSALRWLAAPLIVYLTWFATFGSFNFYSDELYMIDRILMLVFALLGLWRPFALIPLVLLARVIGEQTLFPFLSPAAQNLDDLPAFAVLIIGAGHLWYAVTGRRETSPILLGLMAMLAAHFYLPGRGKFNLGWLADNDTANLPLSSYTAGWLANTDGGVLRTLSNLLESTDPVVKVVTLVAELGALVAVASRRLSTLWLVLWILLHISIFAVTGFVFAGWILLEAGLLIIFMSKSLRSWVSENSTPGRALIAIGSVFASTLFFHPPGLAWFDAPVAYGYRIEAVGESGQSYSVPNSAFVPLDTDVTFMNAEFTGQLPPVSAYGAVISVEEVELLEEIRSFDELVDLEARQPANERAELSENFVVSFFDYANSDSANNGGASLLRTIDPPARNLTLSPEPRFSFQEPLVQLQIFRVSSIHRLSEDGTPLDELLRRELVLTVEQGDDGTGQVISN